MTHELKGVDVLVLSIVVWFLGTWLTSKIRVLKAYSIPPAVTGGLICSGVIALIYYAGGVEVSFDLQLRNLCLLVFFSTIGLSAKLSLLKAGGKALVILLAAASVFLVIQDLTGVLLVKAMGAHPAYGLFGGSVSFAGGHGTAIAWGKVAEEAGLKNAAEIGIACATFGLIAGGLIGGPIAERLIKKHKLSPKTKAGGAEPEEQDKSLNAAPAVPVVLWALLLLGICLGAGDLVNRHLFAKGVMLPGFLTAMMVGILITNLADVWKVPIPAKDIDRFGEICLQLFLAMSLMSMQLWTLAEAIGPILLILTAQMLVMTLFAVFIVFRLMGRDYDAAVIVGGFSGLGMGATPVGIANMQAVTEKYGASPKAFLVIPLIGAFFIDLVNAVVIKAFAASSLLQQSLP
jgi:ESS family glutamate:Na+ symporter